MGSTNSSKIFKKVGILIRRRLGPSSLPYSGNGFHYWRERIFHYFTISLISIGLLAYLYYTISFIQENNFLFATFSTFLFVSSLFISLVRSLPFKLRVFWILMAIYMLGAFLFIKNGPPTLGLVLLLSYSLLSGVLIGQKAGIYSVILNTITLGVSGVLHFTEFYTNDFNIDFDFYDYLNICILFIVVNMITLSPLVSLLNGLSFSLEKEKRFQGLLSKERENLVQAKFKAEESERLKTAFLANMSHEIRTPMNAILGFSNLLSHKEISASEKEEFVNLIRLNGKNLLTLVEDIIDISKIDSGHVQLKNGPCRLNEILNDIFLSFQDDIYRRGQINLKLYLKEGIADPGIIIMTDGGRLRQIIVNLVGNAIKFTDRGYVEFGYTQETPELLKFYVKDTGIGIPAGRENEIFDRFSKFDSGKQKLYGGTGIGLSIARDLTELLGGKIWVESELKVGTTFYFEIPFHRMGSQIKAPVAPEEDIRDFNWEGKTFLVAEDEEDNFRYIEVALSMSNASLIWAKDGEEAVDIFKKINNIDLILMDIKMPQMDGYSATREIRTLNKEVPVIAQTAYSMSEEKDKSMAAGCDDYIAKPIGYEDLLRMIHKYVPGN